MFATMSRQNVRMPQKALIMARSSLYDIAVEHHLQPPVPDNLRLYTEINPFLFVARAETTVFQHTFQRPLTVFPYPDAAQHRAIVLFSLARRLAQDLSSPSTTSTMDKAYLLYAYERFAEAATKGYAWRDGVAARKCLEDLRDFLHPLMRINVKYAFVAPINQIAAVYAKEER
jgi:hypothetical protein